jgi:hypothetical protein
MAEQLGITLPDRRAPTTPRPDAYSGSFTHAAAIGQCVDARCWRFATVGPERRRTDKAVGKRIPDAAPDTHNGLVSSAYLNNRVQRSERALLAPRINAKSLPDCVNIWRRGATIWRLRAYHARPQVSRFHLRVVPHFHSLQSETAQPFPASMKDAYVGTNASRRAGNSLA